ncbi:MAG: hypothetical protein MZV70_42705 [Desulfobacterales bacterium]|nr:hypothetical protein [Desulfobacterales bacterium]
MRRLEASSSWCHSSPRTSSGCSWRNHAPPCLSVYLPTHRRHPENLQDSIRIQNLLKALEGSLLSRASAGEAGTLLDPFRTLALDTGFWNHTWDGLAVLGAAGVFQVINAPAARDRAGRRGQQLPRQAAVAHAAVGRSVSGAEPEPAPDQAVRG